MNTTQLHDLIDPETWLKLRKVAPKVCQMPRDAARAVVSALAGFASSVEPHEDLDGQSYWQAALREIHEAGAMPKDMSMAHVGAACRLMGLVSWREGDGYHVAWSERQLEILGKYFKV
jgi:hypothetical protein